MSAPATQELAETRELARQRRTLENAVADKRQDVADQQRTIASLVPALVNVGDEDAESRLNAARGRLRHLHAVLEAAEKELHDFSENHPTTEQLQAKEYALARQIDENNYRATQEKFAQNTRRRLALFDELRHLEIEAHEIYESAKKQWPQANGRPAHAAICLITDLVSIVPPGFFPVTAAPGRALDYGKLSEYKRQLQEWMHRWGLNSQEGEQQ